MGFITNDEGKKLAYTLSINNKSSPYLAIIIHGLFGNRNYCFFPHLASSLICNTLRFDIQGNGKSEGTFSLGGYSRDIADIKCVINWATSHKFKVIALIGHSKGGNQTLKYASLYSDVPLIITISAGHDLEMLSSFVAGLPDIETKGFATYAFWNKEYIIDKKSVEEVRNLEWNDFVPRVNSTVLVIHAGKDQILKVSHSDEIEKLLGHKCYQKIILDEANHIYVDHESELSSIINNLFANTLHLFVLRGKL